MYRCNIRQTIVVRDPSDPTGNVVVALGPSTDDLPDDHPLVKAYPDYFEKVGSPAPKTPAKKARAKKVEQATAEPGETR